MSETPKPKLTQSCRVSIDSLYFSLECKKYRISIMETTLGYPRIVLSFKHDGEERVFVYDIKSIDDFRILWNKLRPLAKEVRGA